MKISDKLNSALKDAVAAMRQHGGPVEVYWDDKGPHDSAQEGWDGSLASIKDLRQWLSKNAPDNRTVTIYCMGDYRHVKLDTAEVSL